MLRFESRCLTPDPIPISLCKLPPILDIKNWDELICTGKRGCCI